MNKKVVLSLLGVGAMIALFTYLTLSGTAFTCEVTVNFEGMSATRSGAGHSREEAIRAAVDSACGGFGLAMADDIRCGNTPPEHVQCKEPSTGY